MATLGTSSYTEVASGLVYCTLETTVAINITCLSLYCIQIGFHYELTYFDDPGTYVPSSAVSWVTKSGMLDKY